VIGPGLAGDSVLWLPHRAALVEVWRRRRRHAAVLASGVFLAGLFIDYGGGFGLKYAAISVAFGWVLLRRGSYAILRSHWRDFLVLVGIPAVLSVGHFLTGFAGPSDASSPLHYAVRFYNTVSSPALLLLLPMLYAAGAPTVLHQISLGFRVVTAFLILLFVLHGSGAIDLGNYTDFFDHYGLGAIGLDSRIIDGAISERGQYSLRVAFAMPLILGYELATSGPGAMLAFLGLLIVGSRGLLLGAALLLLSWLLLAMSRARRRTLLIRMAVATVLLVAAVATIPALRFRLTDVFVRRTVSAAGGEDYTTLVRLGHLAGYRALVLSKPGILLVGAGPTGAIENPFYSLTAGDGRVTATEFSLLNVALYYGVPYALLYALWLYRGAWRLWRLRHRPGFQRGDLGLIIGAMVFWVTGNINPQMTAPFAILAYMLLAVRSAELAGDQPVAR
jgi:hypothetical protein